MGKQKHFKTLCYCSKWHDRVNGNTYFSCRVYDDRSEKVFYIPFTYGYEDAYKSATISKMAEKGWIPKEYEKEPHMYERENNYPIRWITTTATERECKKHGRE